MKKNKKISKKNKGIKIQLTNIINRKVNKIIENVLVLFVMVAMIFGIVALAGVLVEFFTSIINMKILYYIFFIITIISSIYIIKNL